MTEAKKILKMIESVDPNDTETLDKIDFFVLQYYLFNSVSETAAKGTSFFEGKDVPLIVPQYTRSRDTLKSIRPDGWTMGIMPEKLQRKGECIAIAYGHLKEFKSIISATEELAELHAIIQSLEWERSQ